MRPIDADLLKDGFEEDGHLSPYIEQYIDACPTVETPDQFTISDLKRALLQVKEICDNNRCVNCPFHKMDETNIPYCPMHEDDDGISIHQPAFWVINDEEDA